ncbi:serine hydrolase domain-containing protein [Actinomadura madurae]|uniref:serine hydrolase domain-containing protein n=1 Tax=Actinomadura madurae TaxID=1993 RepID=UPI0024E25957|nr:serine hydrolase domain-containing protein [Actinomadura madurae]
MTPPPRPAGFPATSDQIGPRTRFALGSVTTMFTAVAVHQLVRQGKLNYTDKVGAYLDGFPADIANKVTVHHMLTHTSGLGDHYHMPGYVEASRKWDTPDEVVNGTVGFIRKATWPSRPVPGVRTATRRTACSGRSWPPFRTSPTTRT